MEKRSVREPCKAKKSLVTELDAEGSLWQLALGVKLSQPFSLVSGQLSLLICKEHVVLGRRTLDRMVMLPGAHEQGWVVSQPEVT